MNQIGFATFHAAVMGCAGYLAGCVLKQNPKAFACAALVSSIFFQIVNEINEYLIEDAKVSDDEWKNKSHEEFHRARWYARFASIVLSSLVLALPVGQGETSKIRELAKITSTTFAMSIISYIVGKVGNYCFLGNRDISLFNIDREKAW